MMFEHIKTIQELLFTTADLYGEKTAFSFMEEGTLKAVSYVDFQKQVTLAARALIGKGLKNHKIAVVSENSYLCLLWAYAVPLSGNVLVMIDHVATLQEKAYMVEHSDAKALMYSSFNQPFCDYILADKNSSIQTFCIERDTIGLLHGEFSCALPEGDGDALSYIFYTSGTTGKPKGVMHSQRNFLGSTYCFMQSLKVKDTVFLMLPVHHILPFVNLVMSSLYAGGNTFISSGLKHLLMEIQLVRPYCVFAVPAVIAFFDKMIESTTQGILKSSGVDPLSARKEAFQQLFGGKLEIIPTGGAPLDPDLAKRIQEVGISVINGYGLTETCGSITVNLMEDNRLGSVGRINEMAEGKVQKGELAFKSPYLFKGYYKDAEATAEVFDGEWFLTGDLGHIEDRYVYLTGRRKNLIVLPNGKNVSPEELEVELMKIPEIKEVVVCEVLGKLTAKIYTEASEKIVRGKINNLNKTLASYKQIESIIFYAEEFPKTGSKKIKRGEIANA